MRLTPEEFAKDLVRIFPALKNFRLQGAALTKYFLSQYPDYLENAVSHTAYKIRQAVDAPIEVNRGFFDSETTYQQNIKLALENRQAYITMFHYADMCTEASEEHVPVTSLGHIREMTHATDETIRLEKFRRDNGLDGADRAKLSLHHQIEQLHDKLDDLIDRRDEEMHPDKREILNTRIKHLKEELDARGQQAVVQAGGRPRLRLVNPNPDRPGSGREEDEGDVEPVSVKGFRMGE